MDTLITKTKIDAGAKIIRRGGLVAVPTETVYGLAGNGLDPEAVEKIYEVKGRPAVKPLSLMVPGAEAMETYCRHIPAGARILAAAFWPGPLTLVVRRREGVVADLGGDHATIGVRCPDHDVVRDLARAVGPIVTTSANRTGEPTIETAADIAATFGPGLGAVLDGGRLSDAASTVVDVTGTGLVVLREGPISTADLTDLP